MLIHWKLPRKSRLVKTFQKRNKFQKFTHAPHTNRWTNLSSVMKFLWLQYYKWEFVVGALSLSYRIKSLRTDLKSGFSIRGFGFLRKIKLSGDIDTKKYLNATEILPLAKRTSYMWMKSGLTKWVVNKLGEDKLLIDRAGGPDGDIRAWGYDTQAGERQPKDLSPG